MPDLTKPTKFKKIIDGKEYVIHPETNINMIVGSNGSTLNETIDSINSSITTNTETISTIESTITDLENTITNGNNASKEYVDNKVAEKADVNHEHSVVNETANGLMTPTMATELNDAYNERSKVYYSSTRPEGLREIDLWIQPITESNPE